MLSIFKKTVDSAAHPDRGKPADGGGCCGAGHRHAEESKTGQATQEAVPGAKHPPDEHAAHGH